MGSVLILYRVIAIDLPGFGRKTRGSVRDKGEFLAEVIDTLSPDISPVVVTPSASGAFIFPFLTKYSDKVQNTLFQTVIRLSLQSQSD